MLWLICVVGCPFMVWQTWSRRDNSSLARRSIGLSVALFLFAAAVWLWPGMMVFQKLITGLVMPCSLVWLLLIIIVILAWRKGGRWLRSTSVAALLAYTLFGNLLVAWGLMSWLEADFRHIDATQSGPFDIVFVLGGGVGEGPHGQSCLNDSGDRLMLGARLYVSGHTERIGCSGQRIRGYSTTSRDTVEFTATVLLELGIPERDIVRVSGRNTQEEISAIRECVRERGWKRVGLVTSAWHMRRAMRLADRAGVKLEPLPADFRSHEPVWRQWLFVPRAQAFRDTAAAAKEILAVCVGR